MSTPSSIEPTALVDQQGQHSRTDETSEEVLILSAEGMVTCERFVHNLMYFRYCVMDFSKWETLQHLVSQGRIEQVKGGNVVQFKPTW